jgi:hypothetical protein
MDVSADASQVDESVPATQASILADGRLNTLALEYLRQPSSSSIAMMRSAFRGLLKTNE